MSGRTMGRRRKLSLLTMMQNMSESENSDVLKYKHRFADSRYRLKMQYLFDLLRENFKEASTKDSLLYTVRKSIISMEKDIINLAGTEKLAKCKEEFLGLLEVEECIWKKEKEPSTWWNKIQEVLKEILKSNNTSTVFDVCPNQVSQWTGNSELSRKKYSSKRKRIVLEPKQSVNAVNSSDLTNSFAGLEGTGKYSHSTAEKNLKAGNEYKEEHSFSNSFEDSLYSIECAENNSGLAIFSDAVLHENFGELPEKCLFTDEYLLNNPQFNI